MKNKDKISITLKRDVENTLANSTQKNNSTSINEADIDKNLYTNANNKKDESDNSQKDVIKINILPQKQVQNAIVDIVPTATVVETVITTPTLIQTPVIDLTPIVEVVPVVDTTVVVVEKEKGKFNFF